MINIVKMKTFISLIISIVVLTACVHDNKPPIVKENTQRPEDLFAEATRLHGERKIIEAIEKLKQADKIAPNNPNTIANLASILFEAKLYEQSTKYYERLIQLEPNNSHAKTVYNSSILSSLFGNKKCKEADVSADVNPQVFAAE